ncbi:MAG: phosphatidylglycerol lysyltransferase domain-containing protein [Spirochaetia bacterium]|nr:phosphatidylglycerol lysyltransferase domain-containing protein [Spirochaetia bacterium]
MLQSAGLAFTVVSFAASFFVLAAFFRSHGTQGILAGLAHVPPHKILLSACFAVMSYFFLIFYDYLGTKHLKHPLSFKKCAAASFTSNAFGNSLGLSLLSSSAVRLRLYSLWNFSAGEIASLIAFCGVSGVTGFLALSGIMLFPGVWPQGTSTAMKYFTFGGGITALLLLSAYLGWAVFSRHSFNIFGWRLDPPGAAIASGQISFSLLEWLCCAASFYVLLPGDGPPAGLFLASYVTAEFLGVISNIPGGLGVFDAAAISLLSFDRGSNSGVVGAVILYRIIYYLMPLAISYFVYGAAEASGRGPVLLKRVRGLGRFVSSTPTNLISSLVFIAGATAMLIACLPPAGSKTLALAGIMPGWTDTPLRIMCVLCGAALMAISRPLQKLLLPACKLTAFLLSVCAALLLASGFSYKTASCILLLLLALYLYRDNFYRNTGLFSERPTRGIYFAAVTVAVMCAGFSSLTHTGICLPAIFACAAVIPWPVIYIFIPFKPLAHTADRFDIASAAPIALASGDTLAQLVMSGDKKILFSYSRSSFIMYAQCGPHFVALGDPFGPYAESEELIWKFRRMARGVKGNPVFFNISNRYLHYYRDSGLGIYKIGEEAKTALASYPQDRRKDTGLASTAAHYRSRGFKFNVYPPGLNTAIIKDAAAVSEDWLDARNIREPGFISGYYNPEYLKRFHIASVYRDGRMTAFANILASGDMEEITVDMLRYSRGLDDSIEDYMNYMILLWGKENHYAFFNLGLTPLGSPEFGAYSPPSDRAGAALFNYGSRFHNARALRAEREKFSPVWHPRYIACSSFLDVPSIFSEIAILTKDKQ